MIHGCLADKVLSILRRLAVFVICTCGLTVLALIATALLFPGRGFLKFDRTHIQLDFQELKGGGWQLLSSETVAESVRSPPPSGVRVFVQQHSMGRTHPGLWQAWRTRTWTVEDARNNAGEYLDFATEPHVAGAKRPSDELRAAVVAAVEGHVIPESSLWDLWPSPAERVAPRLSESSLLQWQHWTESPRLPYFTCLAVPSAVLGAVAAYRVRRLTPRQRPS